MGMATKVRKLLKAKEMTLTELAEKVEPKTTKQNIAAKLKRDNLTERDLQAIARACGVKFEGSFVFDDGTKI